MTGQEARDQVFKCCPHCVKWPPHRADGHRVPCAVMECGRKTPAQQEVRR